jgi:hypothetical protein
MKIYIPSAGRADRQLTWERLGPRVLREFGAVIVAPPGDSGGLQKSTGNLSLSCSYAGIAATRQWILDYHTEAYPNDPVVLMLDDDLSIWRRRVGEEVPARYTKATESQILQGLRAFDRRMRKFAHGSIGHALMCHLSLPVSYNGRMLRALAYNVDMVPDDLRFDLPVMEDFDMTLKLLTRGYDSYTTNILVQDQSNNNSEGGCSTYRTPATQSAAAQQLQKRWPEFVRVVERAPKREWKGAFEGAPRTDVRINWKKAAKAGGCKHA